MAACLECNGPMPEEADEDEFCCSERCALLHAQYMPLPDTVPEGW